ncbi:hypothetical protein [Nocardia bovistercoris]|uniref:Uncharacterized protein n=1 Tax=Nocardia bovistercoris TaxID=2785916 RepID=A0A931N2Z1_9NOCA|nr:hypothetical protein [Nocardia bovistercoris]MBH0776571.1 hypothetical protein [Nocardia bovistercoris]
MPDHTDANRFPPPPARAHVSGWTPRMLTRTDDSARRTTPQAQPHRADESASVSVSDVLDYFEKCPQCGYPAQATATVRRFDNGRVETAVHPSCGLPCGWHGAVQVSTQQRMRVDIPAPSAPADARL